MNRVTSTIGALTGASIVLDHVITLPAFRPFRHIIDHLLGTNDKIPGKKYKGPGRGPCSTYYYRHRHDKEYPHEYIWVKGIPWSPFYHKEVTVCKTCGMVETTPKSNMRLYVTAERPTKITYMSDYEMAYEDFKKETGTQDSPMPYDDNLYEFHCWYARNK